MAMPYREDNALCSPTSALEKNRMLSRLGKEVGGTEKISLVDSDILIVERHWGHTQHACTCALTIQKQLQTRYGYIKR